VCTASAFLSRKVSPALVDTSNDPAALVEKGKEAADTAKKVMDEAIAFGKEAAGLVLASKGFKAKALASAASAEKEAEEAKELVEKAQEAADAAAMVEAKKELERIKEAAHKAAIEMAKAHENQEIEAEEHAALAAASAAEPYHAAMVRAQKLVVTFNTKAQELAVASNVVKNQAQQLAARANGYQYVNAPVLAQQVMMQAHQLWESGDAMANQAKDFRAQAEEINAGVPQFQMAAVAAAEAAAGGANSPTFAPVRLPAPM